MLPRVIKRRTQRLHNNSEIHNQSNMTYPKLSKFILHSFLSSRKSLWRIQRVGHNWATESNCTDPLYLSLKFLVKAIFYGRKELRMNMIPRIHSGLSVNSKPSSLCELSKEQLQCCSIFLFGPLSPPSGELRWLQGPDDTWESPLRSTPLSDWLIWEEWRRS